MVRIRSLYIYIRRSRVIHSFVAPALHGTCSLSSSLRPSQSRCVRLHDDQLSKQRSCLIVGVCSLPFFPGYIIILCFPSRRFTKAPMARPHSRGITGGQMHQQTERRDERPTTRMRNSTDDCSKQAGLLACSLAFLLACSAG